MILSNQPLGQYWSTVGHLAFAVEDLQLVYIDKKLLWFIPHRGLDRLSSILIHAHIVLNCQRCGINLVLLG